MSKENKYLPAGILGLTIFLVIFLASGISGVEFQPGMIQVIDDEQNNLIPIGLPDIYSPIWYYVLMCAVTIILPISIILFIKYPEVRKPTIRGLVYVSIYALILFLLSRKTQEETPVLIEEENELINSSII